MHLWCCRKTLTIRLLILCPVILHLGGPGHHLYGFFEIDSPPSSTERRLRLKLTLVASHHSRLLISKLAKHLLRRQDLFEVDHFQMTSNLLTLLQIIGNLVLQFTVVFVKVDGYGPYLRAADNL